MDFIDQVKIIAPGTFQLHHLKTKDNSVLYVTVSGVSPSMRLDSWLRDNDVSTTTNFLADIVWGRRKMTYKNELLSFVLAARDLAAHTDEVSKRILRNAPGFPPDIISATGPYRLVEMVAPGLTRVLCLAYLAVDPIYRVERISNIFEGKQTSL